MRRSVALARQRPLEMEPARRAPEPAPQLERPETRDGTRAPEFAPVAIRFPEDSKVVSPEMGAHLDNLAAELHRMLCESPDLDIWLEALPEDVREDLRPRRLSEARLRAIRSELTRRGVPRAILRPRIAAADAPETARHERPHLLVGVAARLLRPGGTRE